MKLSLTIIGVEAGDGEDKIIRSSLDSLISDTSSMKVYTGGGLVSLTVLKSSIRFNTASCLASSLLTLIQQILLES